MRIEVLTSYRFVAALLVVVHHFGGTLVSFTMANQMVTFFFVLSGFVMTVTYAPRTGFSATSYLANRLARIGPAYYAALLLTIALMLSAPRTTSLAILLNLTLLQAWFPPYPMSINFPAWSLSIEMSFYLSFPFLLGHAKKMAPVSFLGLAALLWGGTQIVLALLLNGKFYAGFPSPSHDLIYYFPLSHLCSFMLGIGGARLFLEKREQWRISALPALAAFVFIIAFIALHRQFEDIISSLVGEKIEWGGSFYAPAFLALIISTSLSDNFLTRGLSLKFPVLLGEASYSLYILQAPASLLYKQWIAPLFHIDWRQHFLLFMLFLIAGSIASYFWLEKPGGQLIRRLFRQQAAAGKS